MTGNKHQNEAKGAEVKEEQKAKEEL